MQQQNIVTYVTCLAGLADSQSELIIIFGISLDPD